MKNKKLIIILCIILPLAVGGLSSLITREGMKEFQNVNQPVITPAPIVFAIVWSVLYILMGIALAKIAIKPDSGKKTLGITLFMIQLAMNFFWSIFFFNSKAYLFAFFWLVIMVFFIIMTTLVFKTIDKTTVYFMIPYILWCILALYLNISVYYLN